MAKFTFKESFNHNGKFNYRNIKDMNVEFFFVWDLNEGFYTGDEFPGIENISLRHVPQHMIIQMRDDINNRTELLSIVYGNNSREDYEELYNKIAKFLSRENCSSAFRFKYETDIEKEHYEYILEIEVID